MKKVVSIFLAMILVFTNFQGWKILKQVDLFQKFNLFQELEQSFAETGTLLEGTGIYYTISNNEVIITDADTSISGDLVIPENIEGYPVTKIGNGAFSICRNLTSIVIPNSVISIGVYAFQECSSLTDITISQEVTSIGNNAFFNCSNLDSIELPHKLTSIGNGAFYGCSSLNSINIPAGVTNINSNTFERCSLLDNISIPQGVESIGDRAFYECESLSNINMSEGIKKIGEYAFYKCSSLSSVNIPQGVEAIENYAFYGCNSLSDINMSEGIKKIGEYAFYRCGLLKNINMPEEIETIGKYAFYECSSLKNISIPKKVQIIEDNLFMGCSSLVSVNIPEGVTKIGNDVFMGCSSLSSIDIPEGITFIGESAFYGCSLLNRINIPKGVTKINKGTFAYCSSLSSINIPEGIISIGSSTFSGCSSLSSINIPKGIEIIENYTFSRCSSLSSISIPEGVQTIEQYAFSGCSLLNRINIPKSVAKIGWKAFDECNNLTICGYKESYAETYANENTIPFISLEDSAILSVKNNEILLEGKEVTLIVDKLDSNYQYKFLEKAGNTWTLIQNYSDKNEALYTPTSAGIKTLYVDIKNTNTNEVTRKYLIVKVENKVLEIESFTANPENNQILGETVELNAKATGGSGDYEYKFLEKSGNNWTVIQNYSDKNIALYTPTSAGSKTIYVDVRDVNTKAVVRNYIMYKVNYSNVVVKSFTVEPEKYAVLGNEVELTALGEGGSENYEYKFLEKDASGNWTKIRDFGSNNEATYIPQTKGNKTLYVDIKDTITKTTVRKSISFKVFESEFNVEIFESDKESPYIINDEVTLTAKATGGSEKYQYKFLIKEGSKWTILQNYSDKYTCKYVTTTTGSKTLYVDVKDTVTGVVIRKYLLLKVVE